MKITLGLMMVLGLIALASAFPNRYYGREEPSEIQQDRIGERLRDGKFEQTEELKALLQEMRLAKMEGRCQSKTLYVSSQSGSSWTINAYYNEAYSSVCFGVSHLAHSCSYNIGGCDSFYGVRLCYDGQNCVAQNSYGVSVRGSYDCQQLLGC